MGARHVPTPASRQADRLSARRLLGVAGDRRGQAVTCSACQTSDHHRAAHYDPALARMMALLCDANGDRYGAAMWRAVARSRERRADA